MVGQTTASAAAAIMAMAFMAPGANAQSGPVGIAFVQAPEQSSGMCIGQSPEEAFACAIAQCVAGGALAEDCVPTNWCQPSGWSVDVFVQHQEGIHWHEVVCGLPSEAIARATALHVCDRTERDYLIECAPVQIYDPSGGPMMVE